MLLQAHKIALGNAPALVSEAFVPAEGQTEFALLREPAGVVLVFANGLNLRRGEHFTVERTKVSITLGYELGPEDQLDITYEVIA